MAKKIKKTYTAPTILKPFDKGGNSSIRVVIETPKGSASKYKFDPELGAFMLSRVLPEGMTFPFDFGFIPSTESDDGDPIDVLLLMDQPAFPGCIVESRLIGVIEGEQVENGKSERNDRLIAVARENRTYSNLHTIADVNKTLLHDIGEFFVNYHRLRGSRFKVLGTRGQRHAERLLKKSLKRNKAA